MDLESVTLKVVFSLPQHKITFICEQDDDEEEEEEEMEDDEEDGDDDESRKLLMIRGMRQRNVATLARISSTLCSESRFP